MCPTQPRSTTFVTSYFLRGSIDRVAVRHLVRGTWERNFFEMIGKAHCIWRPVSSAAIENATRARGRGLPRMESRAEPDQGLRFKRSRTLVVNFNIGRELNRFSWDSSILLFCCSSSSPRNLAWLDNKSCKTQLQTAFLSSPLLRNKSSACWWSFPLISRTGSDKWFHSTCNFLLGSINSLHLGARMDHLLDWDRPSRHNI